jgi:4-amino-4-deoxy-L-arabinose transferase-like glycosyltransferase
MIRPGDCEDRLPLLLIVLALSLWRAIVILTSPLDLYVDEAQYWTWAQALDWGYFSKPPMIAAVIAATTSVCGDGVPCVKSGALLLYPLTTALIWAITRRLFDPRAAFWAAIAFITLPGVALSSVIISTDVPLFVCWSAALYAYLKALDTDGWRWWLAVGMASGAGLLTKYTMGIFAVSVLAHVTVTPGLWRRFASPRPWVGALLAVAIFAPNLLWNAANGWPTLGHTVQISGLETQAGLNWKSFGDFVAGQLGILGPVLFFAWIAQLIRPARWWADPRYRLLACFALPFLAGITAQSLIGRANANWAAMAYAAGTIFVVARLVEHGRQRLLIAALALNLVLTAVVYHYDALADAAGVTLSRKTDVVNKRVRGWRQYGEQLAARAAEHPEAVLAADARDLIALGRYYGGPAAAGMIKWNPNRRADDYYAMSTTLDGLEGRDLIFVSRSGRLPATMDGRFADVQPLAPIQVAIHADYALDFHVWWLRGYRDPATR